MRLVPAKFGSRPGQLLCAGFDGQHAPSALLERIARGDVGFVILFARNIVDAPQVRALVRVLKAAAPAEYPLVVGIDQEGGAVARLPAPWTQWPAMRALGQIDDVVLTAAVARGLATELAELGIDLTFAPVADVDSNPQNPIIGDRSFGRDAELVARQVAVFVRAASDVGVATCVKHFPGHGDTTTDSHTERPIVDYGLERLRGQELRPFAAAVAADVPCMMTAHVVFRALDDSRPATMSPWFGSLLRDELGFAGVAFSDCLEMQAIADHVSVTDAVTAVLVAGYDVPLVCHTPTKQDEARRALESLDEAIVARSLARVAAFKRRWARAVPDGTASHGPPYLEHQRLVQAVLERAVKP